MKSKSLLKLIVLVAGGELFINNLTPGIITIEEIILDSILLISIILCVVYHRRLNILAQRLPFIEEVLDCVEECCNDQDENKGEVDCKCNTPPEEEGA